MAAPSVAPKPSPHRRCMLKLSKSLERQDIDELLYLSEDFIPPAESRAIETGIDLMRSLEKHGRLGPGSYEYLISCLVEVGRNDLVQRLRHDPSVRGDGSETEYTPHLLHWKSRAIQDKQMQFLQKKGELHQLSKDTHFWEGWMSRILQMLSEELRVTGVRVQSPKHAHNTNQALKAAGKLISGTIQNSTSILTELERHDGYSHLLFTSNHSLERFEEDLSTALRISPRHCLTLPMQSEPIVQLREKHPLSDISNKLFTSLSDLLNELYGEAEAKRRLRDTESALAAIKSLLHTNSHLCFGFLSLVHLTDTVAASDDEVLDKEAKEIIASLVHGFPEGAILTVVKPTLEALKGTSVLDALKKDEHTQILFSQNPPPLPCPCKANKCLRFGLLTVLLTLYKSEKLTSCEWKMIQSQIMKHFQAKISEPNYNPFLEIDTIVMESLERLFRRFSTSTLSSMSEQLKHFGFSS